MALEENTKTHIPIEMCVYVYIIVCVCVYYAILFGYIIFWNRSANFLELLLAALSCFILLSRKPVLKPF